MPRGTFKHEDAATQGLRFQEGSALIKESVVAAFQYPPNKETKEQSDAFCALIWRGTRCDAEWNELAGEDNDVEIVHRLGNLTDVRPGYLDPKDFDNLNVEPKDLGSQVGTEGNAVYLEPDKKIGAGWGIFEASLRKCSFKPEISGRGVAPDFIGMQAHFKTEKGAPYIAAKGKNKGKEVTPQNLIVDKIHVYPYDVKKTVATPTTTTTTATATAASGTNGQATDADVMSAIKVLFAGGTHAKVNGGAQVPGLSPDLRKEFPKDKAMPIEDFAKKFASEYMRRKVGPGLAKQITVTLKNPETLYAVGMEVVESQNAFMVDADAKTITFTA